jgi:type IV secretory pathway VirB10-like protein
VKRLRQVIHSNSVQNTVLKDEIVKLREALVNERTRRKRGKPLLLQKPKEDYGGAVFWSPRKVKEARDGQQLQEREQEEPQHQKAETNMLREEARQAKLREKDMRRQARAAARLVREKEKAEKAAEQASRAAARRTAKRLQQTLKTSQKSKKRSLKASTKATSRKRALVRPAGSGEPQGATTGAPALRSRRSRNITPSTRYQ